MYPAPAHYLRRCANLDCRPWSCIRSILRLETNIVNLRKEHLEISSTIEKLTLTDDQISEIQEFCDGIRDRVEMASFDEKRQLLELFDVRGKLAIENNKKVTLLNMSTSTATSVACPNIAFIK